MRTKNAMQLKAFIKNKAKELNIAPQLMLQNYYMECFLDRLSKTEYADNFVIKGGFLISALIGLNNRATMDIDTTIKNLSLNESEISKVISYICSVLADDDFTFVFDHVEPIREDDEYQGLRAFLFIDYDGTRGTLTMDITAGDSIYPSVKQIKCKRYFDKTPIPILSYPTETILAEKLETIISRGLLNTRPRDFYNVYILSKTVSFDSKVLAKALAATCEHRGTRELVKNEAASRIAAIESSEELKALWKKYQKKFPYAKGIVFEDTVGAARKLLENCFGV